MRAYKSLITAIAVILFMTGCAAGPNALTNIQGPVGSGANSSIGDIYVQNVVIAQGVKIIDFGAGFSTETLTN